MGESVSISKLMDKLLSLTGKEIKNFKINNYDIHYKTSPFDRAQVMQFVLILNQLLI